MKRKLRENGLSLVLLTLFLLTWAVGQVLVGHRTFNQDQVDHGQRAVAVGEYLTSAHFVEATAENWESEFLQMGVYVALTIFLFQKGSSESKPLEGKQPVDRDPRHSRHKRDAPWPVRRGGWVLALYTHSLTLAFLLLFAISFAIHAVSGCALYNEERSQHGEAAVTCAAAASGLSRSRTGRASSSPFSAWSCSASSCASAARLSRNPWTLRTARPGNEAAPVIQPCFPPRGADAPRA